MNKIYKFLRKNFPRKLNPKQFFQNLFSFDSKENGIMFLHLSVQDQIMFAKRLAILVHAGIPILTGLQMLKKQASSKSSIRIMDVLIADVENGQFISTSMGKFRKIFGDFAINIVQVGEVSGTLNENLNYLAEELKKKQTLKRKVVSALIYPTVIVVATLAITILLTVYLFPKILPVFKSFNFKLPITTRFLIFVSDLLIQHGYAILFGIVGLAVIIWLLLRNKSIRLIVDRTLLRIPFLGGMMSAYNLANMSRTLGLLLKSSVPIVRAISITADTTVNLAYKKALMEIAEHITKGEKISVHLAKDQGLFPSIMQQMIAVGESAGNLSETLVYLAEMYEGDVEDMTKNLTTIIEPVLMVFMGVLVGFIAISIITPIYGITQNLHQ